MRDPIWIAIIKRGFFYPTPYMVYYLDQLWRHLGVKEMTSYNITEATSPLRAVAKKILPQSQRRPSQPDMPRSWVQTSVNTYEESYPHVMLCSLMKFMWTIKHHRETLTSMHITIKSLLSSYWVSISNAILSIICYFVTVFLCNAHLFHLICTRVVLVLLFMFCANCIWTHRWHIRC